MEFPFHKLISCAKSNTIKTTRSHCKYLQWKTAGVRIVRTPAVAKGNLINSMISAKWGTNYNKIKIGYLQASKKSSGIIYGFLPVTRYCLSSHFWNSSQCPDDYLDFMHLIAVLGSRYGLIILQIANPNCKFYTNSFFYTFLPCGTLSLSRDFAFQSTLIFKSLNAMSIVIFLIPASFFLILSH